MKFLALVFFGASSAFAQWVVVDPTNQAVNLATQANLQANHLEVLQQWATQLNQLREQLQTLQRQLTEVQRVREVMGDPAAAGPIMVMNQLGLAELSHAYGEAAAELRRTVDVVESLRNTADGIFVPLGDTTPLGKNLGRDTRLYRRFAAIERQAANAETTRALVAAKRELLRHDLADALSRLQQAQTQAEVDKLHINIAALNAQMDELSSREREANAQLTAQFFLNEAQAAKERQDLLEKQVSDERQSFTAFGQWQSSLRLTATSLARP